MWHFFLLHVVDSHQCIVGHEVGVHKHFLLNCLPDLIQRQEMLEKLNQLNIANGNLEAMLFGCTAYELRIKESIFKAVHEFISVS